MAADHTVPQARDTRRPAVYLRVSSDTQELSRQERGFEYAARDYPDLEPIRFEDEGVSAFHNRIFDRPGGAALVDAIGRGEVAAVYADHQDRLSRGEAVEWLTFAATCHAAGVRILLDGREQTNDDAGQMLGFFQALQARRESSDKQHRSRSAARSRAERGYWSAGRPPTGYETAPAPDGSTHRTLIHTDDAERVREGFEAVAAGQSINGTARRFGFTPSTFQGLLHKTVYAGFHVWKDGTEYPGGWVPIISRETFERVQGILDRNGHANFRSSNKRQPFGTVARCTCGKLLTPHSGGSSYVYYRCAKGTQKDGHAYAAAELVEAIVAAVLIQSEAALSAFLADESWRELGASAADVDKLAADRAAVEEQVERLAGLIALGGIAGKKAAERAGYLNDRHAELTELHSEATRDAETLRGDLDRLHSALTFQGSYDDPDFMDGYRVLNFWRTATVEEKRSTLEAIFSRIELSPEQMAFTFRHSIRSRIVVSLPQRRRDKETARLHAMGLGLEPPQGGSVGDMSAEGA